MASVTHRSRLSSLVATLALATSLLATTASPAQAAPGNDNLANAQVLRGSSGSVAGTNVGATMETSEFADFTGNSNSVWYRIPLAEGQRLVAHLCTTGTTYHSSVRVYKTTQSSPTMTEVANTLDNYNWGWNANNSGLGAAYASVDCATASTNLPWTISLEAGASLTGWVQVVPYPGETPDGFTLSWYVISPNTDTDKISAKLIVSRTNSDFCTLTVKGSGLPTNTWLIPTLGYGNDNYQSLLSFAKTNGRGVLTHVEDVPRATFDSSHNVSAGLYQADALTKEVVSDVSFVTNRCSPKPA